MEPTATQLTVWYVTMAFPVPSEAFFAVEIEALIRRGVSVEVVTLRGPRDDGPMVAAQQRMRDVAVHYSSWGSVRAGLWAALRSPSTALALWSRLLRDLWRRPAVCAACLWWSLRCLDIQRRAMNDRPDVVHLYWGHAPAMLGWLLLRTDGAPRLTISLSAYDLELALPISFDVARRADGVRTWADANLAELAKHGIVGEHVSLLHQGIRVDHFQPRTKRPGSMVIAARLIPEKGVADAIHLVQALRQRNHDIRLTVFGEGPQRDKLERLSCELGVAEQVKFAGHVSHTELAVGLGEAEYFLLPSTHSAERLPNVVKEAAAAGCCCLTTRTPGIESLIRDGETGFILPAGDFSVWLARLQELIATPRLREECAERARMRVATHFDVDVIARQLEAWWRSSSMQQGLRGGSSNAA